MTSGTAPTLRAVRLRSLTEAECHARLYGGYEPNVTIVRIEPRRPRFETTVSGEALRRGLEQRLDGRLADDAEAA